MQLARVESRAAAARGLGAGDPDAGEGRRPPRTARKLLLRYSLAGLVAVVSPGAGFGFVVTASLPVGCSPPPLLLQAGDSTGIEWTSQVCYITGHRSAYMALHPGCTV